MRGNDPEQLMAATKKQLDLSLLEIRKDWFVEDVM
ncbi:MAG: hypothetical protein ACI8P3_003674 [Saprospiraceae bacterium]